MGTKHARSEEEWFTNTAARKGWAASDLKAAFEQGVEAGNVRASLITLLNCSDKEANSLAQCYTSIKRKLAGVTRGNGTHEASSDFPVSEFNDVIAALKFYQKLKSKEKGLKEQIEGLQAELEGVQSEMNRYERLNSLMAEARTLKVQV